MPGSMRHMLSGHMPLKLMSGCSASPSAGQAYGPILCMRHLERTYLAGSGRSLASGRQAAWPTLQEPLPTSAALPCG